MFYVLCVLLWAGRWVGARVHLCLLGEEVLVVSLTNIAGNKWTQIILLGSLDNIRHSSKQLLRCEW